MDILAPFRMVLRKGWFGAQSDQSNDEVVLASQAPDGQGTDCPKLRFRSYEALNANGELEQPGSLGWVGFDYADRAGRETEMGGLKLELDERFRLRPGVFTQLAGYWKIFAKAPGGTADVDMRCVGTLAHDEALAVFDAQGRLKPTGVNAAGMPPSVMGGPPDRMMSADGRFVTVQQGDGNVVTYDTTLGPVGTPAAAIWSAWGGKINL